MKPQVLILGAGPSGLMAAWAVSQSGGSCLLYDRVIRKPMGTSAGVFYLHAPCDMVLQKYTLHTKAIGTRQGYSQKIYGRPDVPVSFPREPMKTTQVYDGYQAIDILWERFERSIEEHPILGAGHVVQLAEQYSCVISTIPLDKLIGDDLPCIEIMARAENAVAKQNHVIYNGQPNVRWTRISCLNGRWVSEYIPGHEPEQPDTGGIVFKLRKVEPWDAQERERLLAEFPSNIFFTGRYGRWDKQCLTHNVYREVRQWMTG